MHFAFGGCETASFDGRRDEECTPHDIPRALFLAGLTVAFCYILGTVAVLLALPATEMGDLQGLIASDPKHCRIDLGWVGVVPFAAFLITVSNVGAAGAFLAAVARLPFVAGIDRYLPPAFGSVASALENAVGGLADAVRSVALSLFCSGRQAPA